MAKKTAPNFGIIQEEAHATAPTTTEAPVKVEAEQAPKKPTRAPKKAPAGDAVKTIIDAPKTRKGLVVPPPKDEIKGKRFNALLYPSIFENLQAIKELAGFPSINDTINAILKEYIEDHAEEIAKASKSRKKTTKR